MRRLITLLVLTGLCLTVLLPAKPALAQSGNTWQVFYFNNNNWQGSPAYFQSVSYTHRDVYKRQL